jgi:hypothetical protein
MSIKELDQASDTVSLNIAAEPLTLAVDGISLKQFVLNYDAVKAKAENPVFAMMGESFAEKLEANYSGSEWRDWWEPSESSYLYSEMTVRDGEVLAETGESREGVLGEAKTMVTPSPKNAGIVILLSSAVDADAHHFLVKPNLAELKRLGLIE